MDYERKPPKLLHVLFPALLFYVTWPNHTTGDNNTSESLEDRHWRVNKEEMETFSSSLQASNTPKTCLIWQHLKRQCSVSLLDRGHVTPHPRSLITAYPAARLQRKDSTVYFIIGLEDIMLRERSVEWRYLLVHMRWHDMSGPPQVLPKELFTAVCCLFPF
jgi:hypothetical protein